MIIIRANLRYAQPLCFMTKSKEDRNGRITSEVTSLCAGLTVYTRWPASSCCNGGKKNEKKKN